MYTRIDPHVHCRDDKDFVTKFLPSVGVSEDLIKKMTHDNILKTFDEKLGGIK